MVLQISKKGEMLGSTKNNDLLVMKIIALDNPIVIVRRPQRWADLGKLISLQPQYPSGSIKSALKRTVSGVEASTGHEHSIFQF